MCHFLRTSFSFSIFLALKINKQSHVLEIRKHPSHTRARLNTQSPARTNKWSETNHLNWNKHWAFLFSLVWLKLMRVRGKNIERNKMVNEGEGEWNKTSAYKIKHTLNPSLLILCPWFLTFVKPPVVKINMHTLWFFLFFCNENKPCFQISLTWSSTVGTYRDNSKQNKHTTKLFS